MAKKGQRATWENDHFKGPRKSDAARVQKLIQEVRTNKRKLSFIGIN